MKIMETESIITKKGVALTAKLLASKTAIEFTGATAGCGDPTGIDPRDLTDLVMHVMPITLLDVMNPEDGEVLASVELMSKDVKTAFVITEVGVWARDPDEGPILFCYTPLQDDAVTMRAKSSPVGKIFTLDIPIVVSGVVKVIANITPSGYLTKRDLYNAVELSSADVPQVGVRTHYHIVGEVPWYRPLDAPPPETSPAAALDDDGLHDGALLLDDGTVVQLSLQNV